MTFRIRKISGNQRAFEKADRAYRAHLEPYKKSSNSHLWKFFYWDFFHDGYIEEFEIKPDLKSIRLKFSAPNIRRNLPEGRFQYLPPIPFNCTFQGVSHFSLNGPPNIEWDPKQEHAQFMYAEINTSDLVPSGVDPSRYSLLIQFLRGDDLYWLELVFLQVDVEAMEPLTFAMMQTDPNFSMPLFGNSIH